MSTVDPSRPRSTTGAADEDILDRLARLGDAPSATVDGAVIPAIVEADPTGPVVREPSRTVDTAVAEPATLAPTLPPRSTTSAPFDAELALTGDVARPAGRVGRSVTIRRARPRVRRVTRVVRHVDTWSVFKVAFVFNLVLYLVCLVAGVLLWNVAYATGTIDNIEKFFEQFGWQSFEFRGGELFHNLWIGGLFVSIGLTGLAVLMATVFNLITDLVGGIRVSVLEEEVVARAPRRASDDTTS